MNIGTLFRSLLALATACGAAAASEKLRVSNAVFLLPASDGPTVIYFTIHNPTSTSDSLLTISSPTLTAISLHETMRMGEGRSAMIHMQLVARVEIPAHGELSFSPGGYHAMVSDATSPLVNGTALTLTMTFVKHTPIVSTARVLKYADYDPRAAESKR